MSDPLFDETLDLLSRCSSVGDLAAATRLEKLASSQELRDIDLDDERLWQAIHEALHFALGADDALLMTVARFVSFLLAFPETTAAASSTILGGPVPTLALERLETCQEQLLVQLVYQAYERDASLRPAIRRAIATFFHNLKDSRAYTANILVLSLTRSIVQGFDEPISQTNLSLLLDGILPLHLVQGKASPSQASLGIFHRDLVLCVVDFIRKSHTCFPDICHYLLLKAWPSAWEGNSPKEVLFLHEIESLLQVEESWESMQPKCASSIVNRLADSMASDNSTVSERALLFWKDKDLVEKLIAATGDLAMAIHPLVVSLVQHAMVHWNKTVTIMAANAFGFLLETYSALVVDVAFPLFEKKGLVDRTEDKEKQLFAIVEKLSPSFGDSATECMPSHPSNSSSNAARTQVETFVPPKLEDVSFMNMVIGDELGEGSFSKVFHAYKVEKGKPRSQWPSYALKRMETRHRSIAEREAAMMDRVQHPNCTRLVAMYESAESINLVMEFADLGDLHSCISSMGTLDEEASRFIAAEIAAGLDAVHTQGLIFGDLKPENVLVHKNGHVKLGDFGATREMSTVVEGNDPIEGTLCYLAPELFQRRAIDSENKLSIPEAIDWWAFGCIIYQMLTGRPPLWVEEERDMLETLVSFKIEKFPAGFPDTAMDIVTQFLQHDPLERLGSSKGILEVQDHPFFQPLGLSSFHDAHMLPAPKISKGLVKPKAGPWTQRTFSMLLSPLPSSYTTDASDGSSQAFPVLDETDLEKEAPWKPLSRASSNRSTPVGAPPSVLSSSTTARQPFNPTTTAFATTTLRPPSTSAGMLLGRGGSGLPRGRPGRHLVSSSSSKNDEGKSKYAFKGLDLTAG